MEKRYLTDRYSIGRAREYIARHNEAVKAAGGIVAYMAGPTFRRSEPTNTQAKEKKQ